MQADTSAAVLYLTLMTEISIVANTCDHPAVSWQMSAVKDEHWWQISDSFNKQRLLVFSQKQKWPAQFQSTCVTAPHLTGFSN